MFARRALLPAVSPAASKDSQARRRISRPHLRFSHPSADQLETHTYTARPHTHAIAGLGPKAVMAVARSPAPVGAYGGTEDVLSGQPVGETCGILDRSSIQLRGQEL